MILDFTRMFTEEEYARYWDIFERWWSQYEYTYRDNQYTDSEIPLEQEDLDALIIGGVISDDHYLVKRDELVWLYDLSNKVNSVILNLKKYSGYTYECYWPDTNFIKVSILQFLEEKEVNYFLVYQPAPLKRPILLIKDDHIYRELSIVFSFAFTESDAQFLINDRGWRATHRLERLSNDFLDDWLKTNCEGRWKLSLQRYNSKLPIYFERESDLLLYTMRFLGVDEEDQYDN